MVEGNGQRQGAPQPQGKTDDEKKPPSGGNPQTNGNPRRGCDPHANGKQGSSDDPQARGEEETGGGAPAQGEEESGDDSTEGIRNEEAFSPKLSAAEWEDAERRSSLSVRVVHEAIRMEGEDELRRPTGALAWSGLAAGLSMGFSLIAQGLLEAHLPQADWRPLVSKLGYSMGFLIVVLGRQQLFTENTLTVILPLMARRDLATLRNVARLWLTVFVFNIIGAALFAWIVARSGMFDASVSHAFQEIGSRAMEGTFLHNFVRAIFAGWLIALMVWVLPSAEAGRTMVIILLTYLVGLAEFRHVIAGSVDTIYVVASGGSTPWHYLTRFLAPALTGNIVGGVSLVAALNHAQVITGKAEGGEDSPSA